MKSLLTTIALVLLFAVPSRAEPEIRAYYDTLDQFEIQVVFDSTTDDSEYIPTGAKCAYRVTYGGSGTVQLWTIPTASTAAASGTQIGSDITASTSSGPVNFKPGLAGLKAKASVASPGTVMIINCSNTNVGASGGTLGSGDYDDMVAASSSASEGDTWAMTGSSTCATDTPATADILCYYTGSGWSFTNPSSAGGAVLGETLAATTVTITDATSGTDAVIPSADGSNAGVLTSADKGRLDLLHGAYFYTMDPANQSGTNTYGLAEAVTACEASDDGGVVIVHNNGTQTINLSTADAIPALTQCSIEGFGADNVSGGGTPYVEGPSVYSLTNAAGVEFIQIDGSGLFVRNFGIVSTGEDSDYRAVDVGDGTPALGAFTMDGMVISGSTSAGDGTGVEIFEVYKAEILSTSIKRFEHALTLDGGSQEIGIYDSDFRESDVGLYLETSLESNVITSVDSVYEGNVIGIHAAYTATGPDSAKAKLVSIGDYCEPSSLVGATASDRVCIQNDAFQFAFIGTGFVTTASSTAVYDAGNDYVQTRTTTNVWGGSSCHSCRFYRGVTLNTSDYVSFLVTNLAFASSDATFTGNVTGNSVYTSTDCPTQMALEDKMFIGDVCLEAVGSAEIRYMCRDSTAKICRDEADIVADTALDYAWSGAHDFTGATLQAPNESDCSDNTGDGELCVDVEDDTLYVEGTLVTGGGGSIATDTLWDAAGDIVYATADNTGARLAAGSNGEVLTLAAGVPSWAAASSGGTVDGITGDSGAATDNATPQIVGGADITTISEATTDTISIAVDDSFVRNDGNDTMAGTLTADGLTLGANENITLGAQTLDHDGTNFVFNDSVAATNFVSTPTDTAEFFLESATGGDRVTVDLVDNGTTTSMNLQVDDGTGDEVTYVQLDGANALVEIHDVWDFQKDGVLVHTATIDDDVCDTAGEWWYDTTDTAFEFCEAASGAPTTFSAGAGDVTAVFDCASGDCNTVLVESSETLGATGTGTITATGVDAVGAAAIQIGSADVTEITIQSDGATVTEADLAIIADSTITLTSEVTGTLPVANGGTGVTSFGTGVATGLGTNVNSGAGFVTTTGTATLTNKTLTAPVIGAATGTSLNLSGDLTGTVRHTITTGTTHSPADTALRGDWHFYSNAGIVTVTLPAISGDGNSACFHDRDGTAVLRIDPNASDNIILSTAAISDGEYIESAGAAGDFICLLEYDSASWIALGRSGVWVEETP